ncbi:hypothetical protein [Herbaspirillum rhizosphaerae]|uniref:hypothetical protein n=1 Tax=Herbaspirillum rhizosphaerae TaxID=346179 RepID=UPI0012ECF088|nr:hypothetical protein [Herbaspirillum rhizosphaerae]
MGVPASKEELVALFSEVGAGSPESWAKSQIEEGVPQFLRFLFLKNAWDNIPMEGDNRWIDRAISQTRKMPSAPYSGLGGIMSACREKGVTDNDLTHMARCLQVQILFTISHLLEGPTSYPDSIENISWRFFETDEDGRPFGKRISGLHESVLELDPAGREMRPLSNP